MQACFLLIVVGVLLASFIAAMLYVWMSGSTRVCAAEEECAMTRVLSGIFRFYRGKTAGIIGTGLVGLVAVMCLCASLLTPHDPDRRVGRPHVPPSADHMLGTTRAGKDVYAQALFGGQVSMMVAFAAATLTTIIALGLASRRAIPVGASGSCMRAIWSRRGARRRCSTNRAIPI